MKIAFYTLGCKVNQYESSWLSEMAGNRGFLVVPSDEAADIYVVNSCTVTSESNRKTRQAIRRFKRSHPESIVVFTGCVPQAFPKEAEMLEEADIVLGNKNNHLLFSLIEDYLKTFNRIVAIEQHKSGDQFVSCSVSNFEQRTRAYVKIEDGCNRFCSYCAIPYSRGRVRSKKIEDLQAELSVLNQNGFLEVVLVGINLSAYGTDIEKNICDAVKAACMAGFQRVRLGSLEPDHITDEVIEELCKLPQLCPQFHISLQSGCDKTLKAMNRHYTAEQYFQLCQKLRKSFKDAAITTDIMVGFPEESEQDFEESALFAERIGFEKVHVFPYSPRQGTPAAKMNQLENAVKEARSHEMIKRTNKIRQKYLESQKGKTLSVLFETKHEGYTMNYTPVKINSNAPCGKIADVLITDTDQDFCIGEIVNKL